MNLFKKTLLASVVAAVSTGAMAIDVKTATEGVAEANVEVFSAEGLAAGVIVNDGTDVAAIHAPVILTSAAEYSKDDVITLTMSGGEFADTAYVLADGNADLVNKSTVTFGLLSSSKTELTFRVTSVLAGTTTPTTLGNVFTLGHALAGEVLLGSTVADATVTVTAKAQTSTGIKIDETANDVAKVATVKAQFTFVVAPVMAAVIDVAEERKDFVAAGGTVTNPTFTATVANPGAGYIGAFTPVTALAKNTAVVTGKFGAFNGVDDNGTFATGTTDPVTVAADMQSASFALKAATAPVGAHAFTFAKGTDQLAMEASDYTVALTMIDAGTKTITLGAKAAGAMTLNGASVDIPYVPYGDGLEQFIWVTNKGSQTGAITVTARTEAGVDHELEIAADSTPGLKRLSGLIADALEAKGVTSGRVKLNVTVNAPADDITVYAAYKVTSDADRLTLPTVSLND